MCNLPTHLQAERVLLIPSPILQPPPSSKSGHQYKMMMMCFTRAMFSLRLSHSLVLVKFLCNCCCCCLYSAIIIHSLFITTKPIKPINRPNKPLSFSPSVLIKQPSQFFLLLLLILLLPLTGSKSYQNYYSH